MEVLLILLTLNKPYSSSYQEESTYKVESFRPLVEKKDPYLGWSIGVRDWSHEA